VVGITFGGCFEERVRGNKENKNPQPIGWGFFEECFGSFCFLF